LSIPAPVDPSPWGEYPFAKGDSRSVMIGPLRIDLRRENGEVWIAWSRSKGDEAPEPPTEWERWAEAGEGSSLMLRPAFPSRTLIVAPELSFNLVPRSSARIYVRVPLCAQVVLSHPDQTVLTEIPTVVMSNTWWGDFVDGELCFWLPTTARRVLAPEHFQPHLVVCPLLIENLSEDLLNVEKSAVRVAHLSIFDDDGRLWADATRVRYTSDEEGSEIDMSGKAPTEVHDAKRIAAPRIPIARGIRARTFARLKSLSGR